MEKTTVNPIDLVLNLSKKPNIYDFIYQELEIVDSYEIVNLILFENAIRCKDVQELVIKLYNYDIDDLFIEISDLKNDKDNIFITYLTEIYNKIMLIKKAIYSEFEASLNIDELVSLYFNNDIEQFKKTKSLVDNLLSSFDSFDIKDTSDKENKLSQFEKLIDLFDLDIQYIFQIIKARTNNFSKLVDIDNDKMLEYSKMIHILKEKYKLDWNELKKYLDTRIEYMQKASQINNKEEIKQLVLKYRKDIKNQLANIYTKSAVHINLSLFSRPTVQLFYNIHLTIPAYWFNVNNLSKKQFKELVYTTLDLDTLSNNVNTYLDNINQEHLPIFNTYKSFNPETIAKAFYLFDYKQYLIKNEIWNYHTKQEEYEYFSNLLLEMGIKKGIAPNTIKEHMNEIIYKYADCRYKDILKI